ncbi:MAG: hypothetical protein KDI01_01730 [Halioglobus sp.]|nr:hypothetical protein [Halioglobus sp.]
MLKNAIDRASRPYGESVFMVLGVLVAVIAVLSYFYLPEVKGERLSRSNSPLAVLKMSICRADRTPIPSAAA